MYKFRAVLIITLTNLLISSSIWAQNTISETFPGIANQQIKLFGFNGFDTYVINSMQANEKGVFNLSYGEKDYGMGYLSAQDNKPFFIVLSGETILLKGETFALPETIKILEGTENGQPIRWSWIFRISPTS